MMNLYISRTFENCLYATFADIPFMIFILKKTEVCCFDPEGSEDVWIWKETSWKLADSLLAAEYVGTL